MNQIVIKIIVILGLILASVIRSDARGFSVADTITKEKVRAHLQEEFDEMFRILWDSVKSGALQGYSDFDCKKALDSAEWDERYYVERVIQVPEVDWEKLKAEGINTDDIDVIDSVVKEPWDSTGLMGQMGLAYVYRQRSNYSAIETYVKSAVLWKQLRIQGIDLGYSQSVFLDLDEVGAVLGEKRMRLLKNAGLLRVMAGEERFCDGNDTLDATYAAQSIVENSFRTSFRPVKFNEFSLDLLAESIMQGVTALAEFQYNADVPLYKDLSSTHSYKPGNHSDDMYLNIDYELGQTIDMSLDSSEFDDNEFYSIETTYFSVTNTFGWGRSYDFLIHKGDHIQIELLYPVHFYSRILDYHSIVFNYDQAIPKLNAALGYMIRWVVDMD